MDQHNWAYSMIHATDNLSFSVVFDSMRSVVCLGRLPVDIGV